MSQTNTNASLYQQTGGTETPAAKFLEEWEWEGERLVLAYNPYDPTRSQLRPDYSRLVGERGVCQPVVFLNRTTGEEIRKFVVLAKVKAPAEPGSLVPDKYYRCFRLYDVYVDPRIVDWGTLVFYEIKPKDMGVDMSMNEAQRFMNTLLGGQEAAQESTQAHDSKWAEDFAQIQRQATPSVTMTERSEQPQESSNADE